MKLEDESESYVLETQIDCSGGYIPKTRTFDKSEDLITQIETLPISEDIKSVYKKIPLKIVKE